MLHSSCQVWQQSFSAMNFTFYFKQDRTRNVIRRALFVYKLLLLLHMRKIFSVQYFSSSTFRAFIECKNYKVSKEKEMFNNFNDVTSRLFISLSGLCLDRHKLSFHRKKLKHPLRKKFVTTKHPVKEEHKIINQFSSQAILFYWRIKLFKIELRRLNSRRS